MLGYLFMGAALLGAPAAASGAAPQWVVDGSGARCSLSRSLEGGPAATFVLRGHPQAEPLEILLVGADWSGKVKPGTLVTLTLLPGGKTYKIRSGVMLLGQLGKALDLEYIPRALLDDLGKAESFSVSARDRVLATYAIPTAAKAVGAYQFCEREKLVEWGADRASFEPGGAAPVPVGNPRDWLSFQDIREADSHFTLGTVATMVAVRLTIGTDGKVEACERIESSGNERLDGVACRLVSKRAIYVPAKDGTGAPLRSVVIYRTDWRIDSVWGA